MTFTLPARRGVYQRPTGLIVAEELQKHPWAFECKDERCHFFVCADSEEHAQEIEATHPCPYAGGTTTIGLMVSKTLVQQVWDKVDADMLSLMQPEPNTDFPALKTRLRAFAEVLAIFMQPHFTTADEIAKEAKRRYDNRHDETYETAGLGSRRMEPPPGSKRLQEEVGGTAKKATAPYVPPKSIFAKLKPEELAAIKKFSTLGFKVEQLAKTYGVSKAVIEAVLAS